jgi:hypothetical protein
MPSFNSGGTTNFFNNVFITSDRLSIFVSLNALSVTPLNDFNVAKIEKRRDIMEYKQRIGIKNAFFKKIRCNIIF